MHTIFEFKPAKKAKVTLEELQSQTSHVLPSREELIVMDYSMLNTPYYAGTTAYNPGYYNAYTYNDPVASYNASIGGYPSYPTYTTPAYTTPTYTDPNTFAYNSPNYPAPYNAPYVSQNYYYSQPANWNCNINTDWKNCDWNGNWNSNVAWKDCDPDINWKDHGKHSA